MFLDQGPLEQSSKARLADKRDALPARERAVLAGGPLPRPHLLDACVVPEIERANHVVARVVVGAPQLPVVLGVVAADQAPPWVRAAVRVRAWGNIRLSLHAVQLNRFIPGFLS